MSGRKAKALRKQVYGDFSQRERRYLRTPQGTIFSDPNGLRAAYQRAKREKV